MPLGYGGPDLGPPSGAEILFADGKLQILQHLGEGFLGVQRVAFDRFSRRRQRQR